MKELLLYNSKQVIMLMISLSTFECLKITNEFQYLIYENLYEIIDDMKEYYKIHDQKMTQDIEMIYIY